MFKPCAHRWLPAVLGCLFYACTTAPAAIASALPASNSVSPIELNADNPLLSKLSAEDLETARRKARSQFARGWDAINDRSRFVRYRMLNTLRSLSAPESLQAVPVVESAYNPYATSQSGASGLWQLMPATARRLGIQPDSRIDGRRHIDQATTAAVQYLLKLQDRYDSWPLALAAYNFGPNGLSRRLKSTPWNPGDPISKIPVPTMTREYVYLVIGLASLLDDHELSFEEPLKTRALELSPPVDLNRLASNSSLDKHTLFRFNPGLNQAQYLAQPVMIHIPEDAYESVNAQAGCSEPEFIQVVVKSGDTLWSLARQHNISVDMIKQLNRSMNTKLLSIGQRLKFPAGNYSAAAANSNPLIPGRYRIRYKVRNGDSLWAIANRFGTTVTDLTRANGLSRKSIIRAGDTLWIKARVRPS